MEREAALLAAFVDDGCVVIGCVAQALLSAMSGTGMEAAAASSEKCRAEDASCGTGGSLNPAIGGAGGVQASVVCRDNSTADNSQQDPLLGIFTAKQQAYVSKLSTNVAEYKAGLDKARADAVLAKARFDELLAINADQAAQLHTAAEEALERRTSSDQAAEAAAQLKVGYGKLLADNKSYMMQLTKAAADAAVRKAAYDKLLADNKEQKIQLGQATADAAAYKADYDKSLQDALEKDAQVCCLQMSQKHLQA